MKKVIIGLSSIVIAVVSAYFLAPTIKMNSVKEKVIENNSDIENIVTINHISSWGEWFLEYVLVVEMDEQKFRIWTNNEGEILEKEALQD